MYEDGVRLLLLVTRDGDALRLVTIFVSTLPERLRGVIWNQDKDPSL